MTAEGPAAPRPSAEFVSGLKESIPVIVAVFPFGLLFGALAAENGLSASEAVLMSATIYAGASQMVGIELFGGRIAPWLIVFSILAVNFRHVLYSATISRQIGSWTPLQRAVGFFLLIDPQFAAAEQHVERGHRLGFSWYLGLALPIYFCWIAESWAGALFGRLIPNTQALGFDFLLPIYFLGLVLGFRKRPLWLPVVAVSAVASVIAYHLVGSPWHVSIGALAGVALGASIVPSRTEEGAS